MRKYLVQFIMLGLLFVFTANVFAAPTPTCTAVVNELVKESQLGKSLQEISKEARLINYFSPREMKKAIETAQTKIDQMKKNSEISQAQKKAYDEKKARVYEASSEFFKAQTQAPDRYEQAKKKYENAVQNLSDFLKKEKLNEHVNTMTEDAYPLPEAIYGTEMAFERGTVNRDWKMLQELKFKYRIDLDAVDQVEVIHSEAKPEEFSRAIDDVKDNQLKVIYMRIFEIEKVMNKADLQADFKSVLMDKVLLYESGKYDKEIKFVREKMAQLAQTTDVWVFRKAGEIVGALKHKNSSEADDSDRIKDPQGLYLKCEHNYVVEAANEKEKAGRACDPNITTLCSKYIGDARSSVRIKPQIRGIIRNLETEHSSKPRHPMGAPLPKQ
jgi:hypothetical protein